MTIHTADAILRGLLGSDNLDWETEAADALENFHARDYKRAPGLTTVQAATFHWLLTKAGQGELDADGLADLCRLCAVKPGAPLVVFMVAGLDLLASGGAAGDGSKPLGPGSTLFVSNRALRVDHVETRPEYGAGNGWLVVCVSPWGSESTRHSAHKLPASWVAAPRGRISTGGHVYSLRAD